MTFPDQLVRFRKSVWFRVLYLSILALLLTAILPVPPVSYLLVPVTLLVLPYWLRERGYRKYIVNGLIAMIAGMMILSVWTGVTVVARSTSPVLVGGAPGVELSNGTVTPFRGAPTAEYTFSVDVRTDVPVSASEVQVWLNMSFGDILTRGTTARPLAPLNDTDTDFVDGKRYQVRASLGSAQEFVYLFAFSALVDVPVTGPVFAATFADVGPVVSGFVTYFLFLWGFAPSLVLPPAILYFLLLGVHRGYKWSRARRAAAPAKPAAESPDQADRFTCTNCGANVDEDASRCPSCGAVFDEQPEMPPVERAAQLEEGRDQAR